jgi:hypothetical protein
MAGDVNAPILGITSDICGRRNPGPMSGALSGARNNVSTGDILNRLHLLSVIRIVKAVSRHRGSRLSKLEQQRCQPHITVSPAIHRSTGDRLDVTAANNIGQHDNLMRYTIVYNNIHRSTARGPTWKLVPYQAL